MAFLTLLILFGWAPFVLTDEEELPPQVAEQEALPTDDLAAGKKIYEKRCISCHGDEGDGDGPAADRFQPKPRSFKKAEYKYRTTPRGALPTDDDLFKVITNGLPGTGMPDWADVLTEKNRHQVIKYIKTFSDKWEKQEGSPEVVKIGKMVPSSPESIERGKNQFKTLGCNLCHGVEGRGDGPTSSSLKNHRGDPVYPRNLSKNWLFRGGGEAENIYMRFNTGLNGTPMPSFSKALDNEKSWDLANYVRSLSPPKKPERGSMVNSLRTEGPVPTDPDDPLWLEAGPNWFPMMGQISFKKRLFTPSVTDITVKSIFNEKEIGFLLTWDDRSKSKVSKPGAKKQIYSDQVAIQFPEKLQPGGVKKPYFIMGDEKLGVNLWYWSADDNRFFETNANGVWNNSEVEQGNSDITGKGYYKDGQYRVVIKRSLQTADKEKDIQFEQGVFYPIAFFAMDGTNGETGSKRSITPWYFVFMEPEFDTSVYIFPPMVILLAFCVEFVLVKILKKNHKKTS
ncbi:MAG: c-type cytochrome [Nitrospiria bacterium]